MNQFLLEVGMEEVPAPMVAPALKQLGEALTQFLRDQQVPFEAEPNLFGSPRRLAVSMSSVAEGQPDREEVVMGPPEERAFSESGEPQAPALGFARKMEVALDELERIDTDKGRYLAYRRQVRGQLAPELLTQALPELVSSIAWPKNMYWSETRFRFIRPLRWLVALWNDRVIEFSLEGVRSGRLTPGHRTLTDSVPVTLSRASDYLDALRAQFVLADPEERRGKITKELADAVPQGLALIEDPELLEEVVYLHDQPSVVLGEFDTDFLKIPSEILVTVMRHHQKYFSITDPTGALAPYFLAIINNRDDSEGLIRQGHQKVLRARLQDAAFFWESDRQALLESRIDVLGGVLFQESLGSYKDKTRRLEALVGRFFDQPEIKLAARLAKTDLTTEMVREFPELQGVVGGLYAREEGQPESVWRAIYEHYQPTANVDSSHLNPNAARLSLLDKLDSVVGCFQAGIRPTGSSDPFALRRQAQGIVRILLDHKIEYPLWELVDSVSGELGQSSAPELLGEIREFFLGRVRFVFKAEGVEADVLAATLKIGLDRVDDAFRRAQALASMKQEPDFEALASAGKRIRNILQKESPGLDELSGEDFEEAAEKDLFEQYQQLKKTVSGYLDSKEYQGALQSLAGLRPTVDRFFDEILVMADDREVRARRLSLLGQLLTLLNSVGDIAELSSG